MTHVEDAKANFSIIFDDACIKLHIGHRNTCKLYFTPLWSFSSLRFCFNVISDKNFML